MWNLPHHASQQSIDSWRKNACPIMGPICNRIADMVGSRGFTLRQIAGECNMNPSTLYRIVSGQVSPNLSSVVTLMEYLGFEIKKRIDK